ncbi:hypothetical protein HU200_023915 [Digitaria exilis]|uniref:Subtilisin-like protease fibronectin type-III domain-containing protein n=1 Tax=Digitaria exilis TaxID=1010633 RepID=A0A835C302_9POAL|nr:hypothetical protein HU200_023915 [Digitaria exilis]
MNRTAAAGKIVLCFGTTGGVSSEGAALAVYAGKGDGVIFADSISRKTSQDNFWPTVHVDLHQGTQILYYIRASRKATVHISRSKTVVGKTPAPAVAYFSSRGQAPSLPTSSRYSLVATALEYLITSDMYSTPEHTWPTYMYDDTSDVMLAGGTLKAADAFDVGAGHVDPLRAVDPGLVYDAGPRDHVLFLCALGYTAAQIRQLVLPVPSLNTTCPHGGAIAGDLNYPAIMLPDLGTTVTVKRTVTNVGPNRAAVYVSW